MPNMFGGSQDHPDYTGKRPRARSKNECVVDGVRYELVGGFVEVENIDGSVSRYSLTSKLLPARVKRRFATNGRKEGT
jgi:hypothetical protein